MTLSIAYLFTSATENCASSRAVGMRCVGGRNARDKTLSSVWSTRESKDSDIKNGRE